MISLVYTARKNPISWMIRLITRSKVSHVFLEYDDEWGGRWAAEAYAMGFRRVPAVVARQNVVAEFKCNFDTTKIMKKLSEIAYNKFDWLGLFYFAWFIFVWKVFKKKLRKPFHNTAGMFCSEALSTALQAEPGVFLDKDPELISPDMMLEFNESNPKLYPPITR